MMEYTDAHFRHLARLLSRKTTLYTEMVVDSTIVYNPVRPHFLRLRIPHDRSPSPRSLSHPLSAHPDPQEKLERWLAYTTSQHPAVLQLGGSNVKLLAQAAKLSAAYGYDEINLNCGCPSPKVQRAPARGQGALLPAGIAAVSVAVLQVFERWIF